MSDLSLLQQAEFNMREADRIWQRHEAKAAAKASAKLDIELFVDGFGMQTVLEWLSEIALEKADHVFANYQDADLAHSWRCHAAAIDRALTRLDRRAE